MDVNEHERLSNITLRHKLKYRNSFLYPRPTGGGILFNLCPSVQDIFRRIFLSNYWWQKSDIWSQASYMYAILWEMFFDPSRFLLPVCRLGFYTHWTYMRGYHKWALAHSSSCLLLFYISVTVGFSIVRGAVGAWLYGSWIYNCLCDQCLYHHWCCEFESRSGQGVQHYVIKFVSDLRQVGSFLWVLQFPPPIKLTATI